MTDQTGIKTPLVVVVLVTPDGRNTDASAKVPREVGVYLARLNRSFTVEQAIQKPTVVSLIGWVVDSLYAIKAANVWPAPLHTEIQKCKCSHT